MVTSSSRGYSHAKPPSVSKEKDHKFPPKNLLLDEATRQDLRRRKLCYTCKELWELRHSCLGKGKIHYIEVMSDDEDEHEDTELGGDSLHCVERIATLVQWGGAIAALAGTPKCTVFRVHFKGNGW